MSYITLRIIQNDSCLMLQADGGPGLLFPREGLPDRHAEWLGQLGPLGGLEDLTLSLDAFDFEVEDVCCLVHAVGSVPVSPQHKDACGTDEWMCTAAPLRGCVPCCPMGIPYGHVVVLLLPPSETPQFRLTSKDVAFLPDPRPRPVPAPCLAPPHRSGCSSSTRRCRCPPSRCSWG